MRSAEDVIIEVGRSLHTGDCALVIIRKWAEEILYAVEKIQYDLRVEYTEENADTTLVCMFDKDLAQEIEKLKQQI